MHVPFKIHYRNNLIDKKNSYLFPRPSSWDDRNYSYGHQLYPSEYSDEGLCTMLHECSEWMLVFNDKSAFVLAISWREQGIFRWLNDNIHFVLDQHSYLDFYSVGTPKQQSAGGYVAPFWHIILISSQPAFALTPYWCMLSVEATNTNFIIIWIDTTEARTPNQPHLRRAC